MRIGVGSEKSSNDYFDDEVIFSVTRIRSRNSPRRCLGNAAPVKAPGAANCGTLDLFGSKSDLRPALSFELLDSSSAVSRVAISSPLSGRVILFKPNLPFLFSSGLRFLIANRSQIIKICRKCLRPIWKFLFSLIVRKRSSCHAGLMVRLCAHKSSLHRLGIIAYFTCIFTYILPAEPSCGAQGRSI